jgi:hypothetical protein
MSGPDDVLPILNVHHLVMALGNIAKGFPEPSEKALATAPPAWISVFKQATEAILAVLERMNQYKIIRDAVRLLVTSARCRSLTIANIRTFRLGSLLLGLSPPLALESSNTSLCSSKASSNTSSRLSSSSSLPSSGSSCIVSRFDFILLPSISLCARVAQLTSWVPSLPPIG